MMLSVEVAGVPNSNTTVDSNFLSIFSCLLRTLGVSQEMRSDLFRACASDSIVQADLRFWKCASRSFMFNR